MRISIRVDRCASCAGPLDFHLLGLSSELGPPVGRCFRCGKATPTHRAEWGSLGTRGRVWFGFVTALYAVVMGCIGAEFLFAVVQLYRGRYPESDPFLFSDPLFVRLALGCGTAMLVLQGVRVALSIRRQATKIDTPPLAVPFAPDLNFGMQFKVLGVLILSYSAAKMLWR